MCYPDSLLRGISGKFVDSEGILSGEAFQLDSVRKDGFCEISIAWYDEPAAFDILMKQKSERTDEIQFKYGAAEIERKALDIYMKPHVLANQFKYEKKPTAENPYHGNLLVLNELTPAMKKIIKVKLAALGNVNIHPNPYCAVESE